MTPISGARNMEKELNTATKVAARLINCHRWMTHVEANVIMAPRRMSMYRGTTPARLMPPATALPQKFWKSTAKVKARARKKTPARAPGEALPSAPRLVLVLRHV